MNTELSKASWEWEMCLSNDKSITEQDRGIDEQPMQGMKRKEELKKQMLEKDASKCSKMTD